MSAKLPVGSRFTSSRRVRSILIVNCLWLASLLLAFATSANAATYTVTNLSDSGTGSLRAAITSANADSAGVVVFASGVTGTITLQSPLPNVALASTGTMTITGPGAGMLTISGNNTYQILAVATGTLNVSGISFVDGFVGPGNGYNNDPGTGGALYIDIGATINVKNCNFVNNVSNYSGGGAILNEQGTLTVTGSTFAGNIVSSESGFGGAIYNLGQLKVTSTTFSSNTASFGSAIMNYADSQHVGTTATISDTTFVDNVAQDVQCPACGPTGGIYNYSGATLTVRDSTFAGNVTTVSPYDGAGIANLGPMTLTNNIFVEGAVSTECAAGPAPAGQCPANPSTPDANGNFDASAAVLELMPLGYYGGLSQTLLPMPGSPVICGGATAGAKDVNGNTLTTDQRGFSLDPACSTGKLDAGSVQTSFHTVTTAADPGSGTCGATCALRDAITASNAAGHGDIDFSSAVTGTITLGSALPAISGAVNLVGPTTGSLTISGNSANQIFNVTTGSLVASNLTLAHGKSASTGGAINNATGTVSLNNILFSGNTATTLGGAIDNGGTLVINGSTFASNTAPTGSAIYNSGSTDATYSTFSGNAASTGGGIFNNSGASLTLANTTFAANTGGTGTGIDNTGSLSVTNSAFDSTTECVGTGCPSTGNGNVVGATLAPLASNGGPTPTVLPLPGSSAICGGSLALLPPVTTDQRGFSNQNITYTGYSATTPCVDSGAVQTDYTSAQFVGGPYTSTASTFGLTPPVILSVTESGQNVGGVPVTLTFTGTGLALGLSATTVSGSGATFGNLVVSQASVPTDSLSATIPIVGADVLTAAPATLTVNPAPGAATITTANPASAQPSNTSVSLSATVTSAGKAVTAGTVTFTVQAPAGTTVSAPVSTNGVATVTYPLAGIGNGSFTFNVMYSNGGVTYANSIAIGQLTIGKATPTITTLPTASAITYGQTLSASVLTGGVGSVAGTFSFATPSLGPSAGTASEAILFTPNDTTDYGVATGVVSVTVNKANPVVTWPTPPAIPYGTPIGAAEQNATANTPGSFFYTTPNGTIFSVGTHPLGAAFLPTDSTDYNPVSAYSTITVTKATPTIKWATPAAINYGTALSSAQLNATASVAGTFSYSPAAGTVPAAGADTLSVTFTPSDTTDYTTATASVTLSVTIPPTPIAPYIEVNGGAWQATNTVTVAAGSVVNLGPQPLTGGSWSWTGPNGFTSTSREIDNIPLVSGVNTYVATYTNPSGAKTTATFTITVTGWVEIGTSASNIAVGSDGTLVMVNTPYQTVWEYTPASGKWTQLPSVVSQVAVVNANSIWCIGTDRNVYRLSGGAWIKVGISADSIAAGADGTVIVANYPAQTIWKYVSDNNWTLVPGGGLANVVSVVKSNDYYIVGSGPGYWAWNFNGAWSEVGEAAFSWISSASDGTVVTTNSAHNIYQLVSPNNWTQLTGTMKEVVVQKNGSYYAIGTDNNVYSYGSH